jgi:O-antigen ligase
MRRGDLPYFTTAAVLLLALASIATGGSGDGLAKLVWWKRDLYFWSGLLFLAYVGVQWWNAGRDLRFDSDAGRWFYTEPRHPLCPWAFTRPEAAQMLHWFLPAWAVGLCVRSPAMTGQGLSLFVRLLLSSAAVLAACGAIQHLSGVGVMFWRMPAGALSFASFPYANHAAAYFLLLGAVAAGLLYREVFRRDRPVRKALATRLTAALLLCLMAANLSLSRAGIVLAWALALFVVVYGLFRGWRLMRPVTRVRLVAATVAASTIFFFLVVDFAGTAIREEFAVRRRPISQLIPAMKQVNLDLSDRPRLWAAAWSVFTENPWYGAGGWGFRYLLPLHLPPEQWPYVQGNPGRSNVHCDPLQFLVEFGVVGAGLLAVALAALAVPLFGSGVSRGAVFTMTCTGLAVVAVLSMTDLPFRCPSVLWTWTAMLAALPKLTARRREPEDESFAATHT